MLVLQNLVARNIPRVNTCVVHCSNILSCQVGSMEFHAHRAVLACASPHLFELFTADDENKGSQRENVITYKLNGGFDRTALEKLIHYAYTARYSCDLRG